MRRKRKMKDTKIIKNLTLGDVISCNDFEYINKGFPNLTKDTEITEAYKVILPISIGLNYSQSSVSEKVNDIINVLSYFITLDETKKQDEKTFQLQHEKKKILMYMQ